MLSNSCIRQRDSVPGGNKTRSKRATLAVWGRWWSGGIVDQDGVSGDVHVGLGDAGGVRSRHAGCKVLCIEGLVAQ